jgi:hypothetical protein
MACVEAAGTERKDRLQVALPDGAGNLSASNAGQIYAKRLGNVRRHRRRCRSGAEALGRAGFRPLRVSTSAVASQPRSRSTTPDEFLSRSYRLWKWWSRGARTWAAPRETTSPSSDCAVGRAQGVSRRKRPLRRHDRGRCTGCVNRWSGSAPVSAIRFVPSQARGIAVRHGVAFGAPNCQTSCQVF